MAVLILVATCLSQRSLKRRCIRQSIDTLSFYHGVRDLTVLHRRGDESCTMNASMHRFTYWKEFDGA